MVERKGLSDLVHSLTMEAGADGNIYLMRWTAPAIFYAISPGGEVVRRFTVDPGDRNYRSVTMHISGSRIATLFLQPHTKETLMKITDLEGQGDCPELR